MPELVLIELDPALGDAEPDPEIQDLIAASAGINLGVDFLPGSLPYDPTAPPDPKLAADVVWLDALITNVDRTPRNPNLLRWHGEPVADRPRRGAVRLPRRRSAGPRAQRLPGDPRPRAAARGGVDRRRRRAAGRSAPTRRRRLRSCRPSGPTATLYAEFLTRRLEAPRELAEEAERARA